MPNLKEVIISITNRCNIKCRMCDIPIEKTEELATYQWKNVIKDASSIGAQTIVFSGGEPLLREDIFDLITSVKNNSMNACITSNGYFIDNEIASRLYQSGVGVVNISIEGPPKIHDYLRGRGTFDKAISALENLRKHKIETTIATMVSRYNYKYLNYIVEVGRRYGVTTIKFQPFSKIFLDNGDREGEFLISNKEIKDIKQVVVGVVRLCSNYGIATNPSSYLEMIPFYLSKQYPNKKIACEALWDSCPINARGEVYPCWVLTQKDKLIGDIKSEDISAIWYSQRRNTIIEKIKNEGCPGCILSCYDRNFGEDTLERKIVINLKRFQRDGPYEYVKCIIKRWRKRLKFYSSYRGSWKGIINKLKGKFIKKRLFKMTINKREIDNALTEICVAKEMLKHEIKCRA